MQIPDCLDPLRQAAKGALAVVQEAEFVGPVEERQRLCADDFACLSDFWLCEESLDLEAIVRRVYDDGFWVGDGELTAADPELGRQIKEPERLWRLILVVSRSIVRGDNVYLPPPISQRRGRALEYGAPPLCRLQ